MYKETLLSSVIKESIDKIATIIPHEILKILNIL